MSTESEFFPSDSAVVSNHFIIKNLYSHLMKFKGIEKKNFSCIIRYSTELYNTTKFDVSEANKKKINAEFSFLLLKLKLIDF